MDWFPIVFGGFKVIVLGTGMFFAIKWHYEQDKKKKAEDKARQEAAERRAAAERAAAEQIAEAAE